MTPTKYVVQKSYGRFRILGFRDGAYETVVTFEDQYDTLALAYALCDIMNEVLAQAHYFRKEEVKP